MHADDLVELLLGHLAHRGIAGYPGIVHHDVQAAEPLNRSQDEGVDVGCPGDVASHARRNLRPAEALRRSLGGLEVQIAENHFGPLGDEALRNGETQPLCTAGNDRCLAGQQRHLITRPQIWPPYEGPLNPTSYFIYDLADEWPG